jgi:hypothetical protein
LSKSTVIATSPPVAGVSMMPTGIFLALYFFITLTIAWLSIGSLMIAEGPFNRSKSHCCNWVVLSKLELTAWKRQSLASTARFTASS